MKLVKYENNYECFMACERLILSLTSRSVICLTVITY